MQRILGLRIAKWYFKLAYVAGVWIVANVLQSLLELVNVPAAASNLMGSALSLGGILLGARIFRGRNELVPTPRPWWQMTARRPLSVVLGILAALVAVATVGLLVGGALGDATYERSLELLTIPVVVTNALWFAVLAYLYLNSAVRLGQQATTRPSPVMPDRRSTAWVVQEVVRVLNEYDLSGVSPGKEDGAPLDEYENEALPIAGVLLRRGSVNRSDISAVWLKWFGNDLSSLPKDTWAELLRDLNAIVAALRS